MTPVPLRLKAVPAAAGLHWLRLGVRVFTRRPLAYCALFASFLFAVLVLSLLPFIGTFAVLAAMPLVTLGFMLATRAVLQDHTPTPAVFVMPLKADPLRRRTLLTLGAVYAVASIAVLLISGWIDGGSVDALQDVMADADASHGDIQDRLTDPRLQAGVLLRMALAAALAVPFWHASALVWWGGQGVAQALFSSTLAVWRARGAFLLYGAGWAGMLALFSTLLALAGQLLGLGGLAGAAIMPAVLLFSTVFYASLYFSFADSFEQVPSGSTADPTPEPPAAG